MAPVSRALPTPAGPTHASGRPLPCVVLAWRRRGGGGKRGWGGIPPARGTAVLRRRLSGSRQGSDSDAAGAGGRSGGVAESPSPSRGVTRRRPGGVSRCWRRTASGGSDTWGATRAAAAGRPFGPFKLLTTSSRRVCHGDPSHANPLLCAGFGGGGGGAGGKERGGAGLRGGRGAERAAAAAGPPPAATAGSGALSLEAVRAEAAGPVGARPPEYGISPAGGKGGTGPKATGLRGQD